MDLPCLNTLADGSIALRLHVQPRASSNGLAGLQGDLLKLRLTTPPVDGKANKAVIAFWAKLLKIPKSKITLKSGHQSRSKTIIIQGVEAEHLVQVIKGCIQ